MYIGIDPGKTTGIAIYNQSTDEMQGWQIEFDNIGNWFNASFANFKDPENEVLIACEIFTIRSAKYAKDAHWALEVTGILRYLCQCYKIPLVMQLAASAKNFAQDEKLRKAGWYMPGSKHANDAVRHVALLMASKKIAPPWVIRYE